MEDSQSRYYKVHNFNKYGLIKQENFYGWNLYLFLCLISAKRAFFLCPIIKGGFKHEKRKNI